MASLVLSAAGTALGGPVGGAIGSVVGRQIDRSFGRSAPDKLRDLRFPSSQYGEDIPAILGRMRIAGVVLWSAKPVATTTVSKSGSVQGVSVSFALGLSSARVEEVARIWADGRLIRDGQGRQDVPFQMRLHKGEEDQASDPLIASTLGDESAPAFRGIAYLVFENFDLSSFGNRLPLITVEVTANEGVIEAEQVLCDSLSLAGADREPPHLLEGFALSGDQTIDALAPLYAALDPSFAYRAAGWTQEDSQVLHLIEPKLWMLREDRHATTDAATGAGPPSKVSVRYFDPSIDYAASEKSARFPGPERLRRIELPAAISGEQAKTIAFEQLGRVSKNATFRWLRLPLSYATIDLGDQVACEAAPQSVYRVCAKVLKSGVLRLKVRPRKLRLDPLPGEAGGVSAKAFLERRPLSAALIELPASPDGGNDAEVAVLVDGGFEPFQPLTVEISANGINQSLLSASKPSPPGILLAPLPCGATDIIDERLTLQVAFAQDPLLASVNEDALFAGANLLNVDGEFLQFATAKSLGAGRYELSGLIRGLFDTKADVAHEAGARVNLLNAGSYCTFRVPRERWGATFAALAYGPDDLTANASLAVVGLAGTPWAPDHISVSDTEDGLQVGWVRRGMAGVPWIDGVDTPVGASREAYAICLSDQAGSQFQIETDTSSVFIARESLIHFGARPWLLEVRQLGDAAAGNVRTHPIS